MASKTIIELPVLSTATANTQNTVFVVYDKISGTTKQFTLAALDTAIASASANAQSTADGAFAKANSANTLAQNAYNQANTDFTTISTTAGVYGNAITVPIITLAANGRVSLITNTAITGFANTTYTQAAFGTANSAYSLALIANTVAAAAYTQANSGTTLAQGAFDTANTDTTNITTTAGVYGNSTIVPVITLAANGRVSSITNTAITFTANTLTHIGTVPSTNKGIVGHTKGMVFLANNFIYYCSTNYDGTTNIWSRIASTDAW